MRIKHIAVMASGIDEEYQNAILRGIHSAAEEHGVSLSHFIAFGGVMSNRLADEGEYNVFRLADFRQFDGVILLANTFSTAEVLEELIAKIQIAGIPAVSIDQELEGFDYIGIDNGAAMEAMVRHIVEYHGKRRVNFISGPADNSESMIRLDAYRRVLEEHHIPIEEHRIYHGFFRGEDGRAAVETFFMQEEPFPEAIVCANDAMAISAMGALDRHGIRVPEDVLVTGFDHTYYARNYAPEISSVGRPLFSSGRMACELLIRRLEGQMQPRSYRMGMEQYYTQSCGCGNRYADDPISYKRRNFQTVDRYSAESAMISRMACALAETDCFEDYVETLKEFVLETKCEEFYLCLCDHWRSGTQIAAGAMRFHEMTQELRHFSNCFLVSLCYQNGRFGSMPPFLAEEVLPGLHSEERCRKLYFVPLHFRGRCLGFAALVNTAFPLDSQMFHSWVLNVSNSLENIRKIDCLNAVMQELDKLYVIDPLSKISNRNGFCRQTEEQYMQCQNQEIPVMVLFSDLDGLKKINDTYGHQEGDHAILTFAEILKDCCEEGEICCRFGGDEFIVFAAGYTEARTIQLLRRIEEKITVSNSVSGAPYCLSASFGWHVAVPRRDQTLFQMISVADQRMYETKRRKRSGVL